MPQVNRVFAPVGALALTLLSACGNGSGAAPSAAGSTATSASKTAAAPPKGEPSAATTSPWCAKLGGSGAGTIGSNCAVKSAPFEVTVQERYADGIDGRACSIKNTSSEAYTFGGVKGFYYDKDGKLLAIKPTNRAEATQLFSHSGSDFTVKPGETIEYECGWQRTDEPAGSKLEVEVYQWGSDDPEERYFTRDLGGKAWESRPPGGFR